VDRLLHQQQFQTLFHDLFFPIKSFPIKSFPVKSFPIKSLPSNLCDQSGDRRGLEAMRISSQSRRVG
jgi:hypothetical protein